MIQLRYATSEDAQALFEVESASFPEAEACSLENFQKRLAVFADCFIVLEEDGTLDHWPQGFFDEWELALRQINQP